MSFPKPSFFHRKHENSKYAKKREQMTMELDMDDSVKQLIDSSKKCSSILLDVTVIRPADQTTNTNKKFITQTSTLNTTQVRKLIASMEMGNNDKSKLLDKIFGQGSNDCVMKISKHVTPLITEETSHQGAFSSWRRSETFQGKRDKHRSSLPWDRFNKKNCSGTLYETLSKISSGVALNRTSSECCLSNRRFEGDGDQQNMQHIYTTAKSFNLKNVFACKNKSGFEDKDEEPCNCQNCAIVNVIEDTQKKPMFAGPIEASGFEERRYHGRTRKYPSEHAICNLQYTQLTKKINELEERLAAQEERSVAKDYFKRIITKLVNHITKITSGSQEKIHTSNYHAKYDKYSEKYDRYSDNDQKYQNRSNYDQRYYVSPMMFSDLNEPKEKVSVNYSEKETCDSNTQSNDIDGFWKWGGEILKPGIDLKNKIMQLMEDYLNRKKNGPATKDPELGCTPNLVKNDCDKDIKIYVDVISNNLHHKNLSNASTPVIYITKSGVYKKDKDKLNKTRKNEPDIFLSKKEYRPKDVNVAYVNPNIKSWTEYSLSTSLGSSFSDHVEYEICKEKFKEILSNTKSEGKKRLWNTIWNQAVLNGQKKTDYVTIQVPNENNEVMEMYYTIAELENILTNDHFYSTKNHYNY